MWGSRENRAGRADAAGILGGRMGAADGVWPRFGEAQRTDLAGFDKAFHSADGFLDWSLGVDAVLVVEVNVIDA